MLTNQRSLATMAGGCVCFLALLGLSQGLDHWTQRDAMYRPHSNFEIDEENSKVIVTTTNSIFQLSLDLQTKTKVIQTEPSLDEIETCRDELRLLEQCQSYPRVLVLPGEGWTITGKDGMVWNSSDILLTCSSNAFAPRCDYRSKSDLDWVMNYPGHHFTPYGSFTWIPSLWTSTGELVVATPQDQLSSKFGITLSNSPFSGDVRATTRTNQRIWFNRTPTFVSMHEIGEYVYIFFREEAVEAEERIVYSRVARICKNDLGSPLEPDSDTNTFNTFIKARISCTSSVGSSGPLYHYNEIYGTHYDSEEQRLYAVFRSAQNGPLGSVVCSYSVGVLPDDFQDAFNGKYLIESANEFISRSNFSPFKCDGNRPVNADTRSEVLMQDIVTQSTARPILMLEGHAFQRIVADTINGHRVLFISATRESDGALVLLKVLLTGVGDAPSYHVIDTTVLPTPPDSTPKVNKMALHGSGPSAHVYVGMETDIYRVPVQTCSTSFASCCECVVARDPYCGFDSTEDSCVTLDLTNRVQGIVQDVTNGSSDVCAAVTLGSVGKTPPTSPGKACSGSVAPGGETGTSSGGGVVNEGTTAESAGPGSTGSFATPAILGLSERRKALQGNESWIIVGTVAGFVGGVVLGIITVVLFKRFGMRRSKSLDLVGPREITNDTHVHNIGRSKKVGGSSGGGVGGAQPMEDVLRINNSTSDFSTSNNFTRSGNEFAHQAYKEAQSPVKYPLTIPEGASEATDEKKCLATPPESPPSPECTKSQPSVFTFTPSSLHMPPHGHMPKSPPYGNGIAGAGDVPHQGTPSGAKPHLTDPNVQLNYKARVYLTDSQREAYGRNILARMPSIDGSKSKYIVEHPARTSRSSLYSSDSLSQGSRVSPSESLPRGARVYPTDSLPRGARVYPTDSLPRGASYHRRQDMVQLDAELGCSQC